MQHPYLSIQRKKQSNLKDCFVSAIHSKKNKFFDSDIDLLIAILNYNSTSILYFFF
nr:MAG TPA: hypothetical protein [Caudoviricetes sp.]